MTLLQLTYFIDLAQSLNYSVTAQRLFVSQSTISKQILSLEKELKFRLFDRSHHFVRLTPAGAYLYKEARQVLNTLDAAIEQARNLDQNQFTVFNVGIMSFMNLESIMPNFFAKLFCSYPTCRINLESYPLEMLEALLRNGNLDAIIVRSLDELPDRTLSRHILTRSGVYVYYASSLFSDGAQPTRVEDFDGLPVLELQMDSQRDTSGTSGLERFAVNYQFHPSRIVSMNTWEGAVSLLQSGFGVMLIGSSFLIQPSDSIRRFPIQNCAIQAGADLLWSSQNPNPFMPVFLQELDHYLQAGPAH